jgi:hypothetical protein
MIKILIETVPFAEIPNAQCGDWRRGKDGTIHIRVAKEIGDDSAALVILHEFIEMMLCEKRGISCASVDAFDEAFESNRKPGDISEAGDSINSPYAEEHCAASGIERLLASMLGVSWAEHERRINNLQ